MNWTRRAACQGLPVEMFVPNTEEHGRHVDYSAGLAICQRCPVTEECLRQAEREEGSGYAYGLRGGLVPAERVRRRRRELRQRRAG